MFARMRMMVALPEFTTMIPFLSVAMATEPIWSTLSATFKLSSWTGLLVFALMMRILSWGGWDWAMAMVGSSAGHSNSAAVRGRTPGLSETRGTKVLSVGL